MVVKWIHQLFFQMAKPWQIEKGMAALLMFDPSLAQKGPTPLVRSWRALKGMKILIPSTSKCPRAYCLWCGICVRLVRKGQWRMAVAILIGLPCLFRIKELLSVRCGDFLPPSSHGIRSWSISLHPSSRDGVSKTGLQDENIPIATPLGTWLNPVIELLARRPPRRVLASNALCRVPSRAQSSDARAGHTRGTVQRDTALGSLNRGSEKEPHVARGRQAGALEDDRLPKEVRKKRRAQQKHSAPYGTAAKILYRSGARHSECHPARASLRRPATFTSGYGCFERPEALRCSGQHGRCSFSQKGHLNLDGGSRTRLAQKYPIQLCKAIAGVLHAAVVCRKRRGQMWDVLSGAGTDWACHQWRWIRVYVLLMILVRCNS